MFIVISRDVVVLRTVANCTWVLGGLIRVRLCFIGRSLAEEGGILGRRDRGLSVGWIYLAHILSG